MTSARTVRLYLTDAAATSSASQKKRAARCDDQSCANAAVSNSLEALIADSLDAVYRYALRLTRNPELAQDLTQETFLRGWKSRHQLADPNAAKGWLLRIASNVWTDWQRRAKRQTTENAASVTDRQPSIPMQLIHREQLDVVLAALDELPPRQQQVVHLVCVERLSQAEVATILDISESAVKANLSAGRKKMRKQLESVYDEVCANRPKRVGP